MKKEAVKFLWNLTASFLLYMVGLIPYKSLQVTFAQLL